MNAISSDDAALVRRAADRLHRFDIQVAGDRLQLDPTSAERCHFDLVTAMTRRRLLRALDIARCVVAA